MSTVNSRIKNTTFNVGCMSDYMMVIYDNTNLFVE